MTMPDPIGVSGPGPMSQRTDKQPMRAPTGLPYGDAGKLMAAQQAVPLPDTTPDPGSPPPVMLHADTQNPGQPVTAGAAMGPGPGPEVLGPQGQGMPTGGQVAQALARVASSDSSGVFAQLYSIALQKGL